MLPPSSIPRQPVHAVKSTAPHHIQVAAAAAVLLVPVSAMAKYSSHSVLVHHVLRAPVSVMLLAKRIPSFVITISVAVAAADHTYNHRNRHHPCRRVVTMVHIVNQRHNNNTNHIHIHIINIHHRRHRSPPMQAPAPATYSVRRKRQRTNAVVWQQRRHQHRRPRVAWADIRDCIVASQMHKSGKWGTIKFEFFFILSADYSTF